MKRKWLYLRFENGYFHRMSNGEESGYSGEEFGFSSALDNRFEAGYGHSQVYVSFPFETSVWASFHLKGGRTYMLKLEWARTEEEMIQGYMFRPSMEPSNGMLFRYEFPDLLDFHTYGVNFSLDFLYLSPEGRVLDVIKNVKPDAKVAARVISDAVLEIPGGSCDSQHIQKGDYVHLIFPDNEWN